MNIASYRSGRSGWRTAGIILAALLFGLAVVELMFRPDGDTATWRAIALSSLYLALCLSQHRLFAPPRHRGR